MCDEHTPARAAVEPVVSLGLIEVHAPLSKRGGRDGAAKPEEGEAFEFDRGSVEDVKVLEARARGLEFVGRFSVAADEDSRAAQCGQGVDDGLESFSPGREVAGADQYVAGACADGESLDGAEVAVDVTEREDFHAMLPGLEESIFVDAASARGSFRFACSAFAFDPAAVGLRRRARQGPVSKACRGCG